MQKDTREENVITLEEQLFIEVQLNVQQATKEQTMAEAQQRLMEMEQREIEAVVKRRCIILDRTTLLEKGINILNPKCFMWTQTKQNNDKHIEQMENWKDIVMEENQASEKRLVLLFLMGWEMPMFDVMLEFMNTFLIKGVNVYFGHQDKVYVINK